MGDQWVVLIVGLVLLVFGLFNAWKLFKFHSKKNASIAWPVAPGEVLSKNIREQRGSKGGKTYIPEITYRYSVMGNQFERKLSLGARGLRSGADKAIDAVGNTIEVRYNPSKPEEHISDQEKVRVTDYIFTILPLALVALLLFVFLS